MSYFLHFRCIIFIMLFVSLSCFSSFNPFTETFGDFSQHSRTFQFFDSSVIDSSLFIVGSTFNGWGLTQDHVIVTSLDLSGGVEWLGLLGGNPSLGGILPERLISLSDGMGIVLDGSEYYDLVLWQAYKFLVRMNVTKENATVQWKIETGEICRGSSVVELGFGDEAEKPILWVLSCPNTVTEKSSLYMLKVSPNTGSLISPTNVVQYSYLDEGTPVNIVILDVKKFTNSTHDSNGYILGGFLHLDSSYYNAILIRLDEDLNILWSVKVGDDYPPTQINKVVPSAAADGGFAGVGVIPYSWSSSVDEDEMLFIKVNSSGEVVSVRNIRFSTCQEEEEEEGCATVGYGIADVSDGSFLLCGTGKDLLIRVNSSGNLIWAKEFSIATDHRDYFRGVNRFEKEEEEKKVSYFVALGMQTEENIEGHSTNNALISSFREEDVLLIQGSEDLSCSGTYVDVTPKISSSYPNFTSLTIPSEGFERMILPDVEVRLDLRFNPDDTLELSYEGEYGGLLSFDVVSRDCWSCNGILKSDTNDVCSGPDRGECRDDSICYCREPYTGPSCESFMCFGIDKERADEVCSGNGVCAHPDACVCNSGFEGSKCETIIPEQGDGLIVPLVLLSVFFLGIICCICCCCLICCVLTMLFCSLVLISSGICFVKITKLRRRVSKYSKLKDIDILLQEQLLVEKEQQDGNFNPIRIDVRKELLEIEFSDLKLLEIIGRGGVFKCEYKGRIVAFKRFGRRSNFNSENQFRDFQREISILSSINHENILNFYGCSIENIFGIVIEYCHNGNLKQFLSEGGDGKEYTFIRRLKIMVEISSAMEFLHSKNIIHRDLKPENCLVTKVGRIKVTDFGLSRIFGRSDEEEQYSKTKGIGTNIYMAPEITTGGEYDETVDCYSFGIMIWEIVTCSFRPFGENWNDRIEFRVAYDPSLRPDVEMMSNCPKYLKKLASDCWDHDPANRISFERIRRLLQSKLEKEIVVYLVQDNDDDDDDEEDFLLKVKTMEELERLVREEWKRDELCDDNDNDIKKKFVFRFFEGGKELRNDEDVVELDNACLIRVRILEEEI